MGKITEVEIDGITLHMDEDRLDDLEFVENMSKAARGDLAAFIPALQGVLGDDYDTVKEHLRNPETGKVKLSDMNAFFMRVMQEGTVKN